jgi:hypothetical protein
MKTIIHSITPPLISENRWPIYFWYSRYSRYTVVINEIYNRGYLGIEITPAREPINAEWRTRIIV